MLGQVARAAAAELADREATKRAANPRRWWITRGALAGVLVVGWLFIAWQNHFHVTPPLVFVCLGYLAAVMTIYNLWRTGAAVAADDDEDEGGADAWGAPIGARAELEREKKTVLKAIKEAEFDHQMGKLSKRDSDHMVAVYRARAIELIKAIERLDGGSKLSVRERIEREVRARIEVDDKTTKKVDAKRASADAKQNAKQAKGDKAKADKATAKADDAKTEAKSDDAKPDDVKTDDAKADDAKADIKAEAKPDDDHQDAPPAKADASSAKEATP